ncbi:MAG: hypothetical protein Q7S88_02340 [Candidatus Daviesbacteria bacterium]|nr:hypothetical protein [Candidatus Daviesbacteria bacterium]
MLDERTEILIDTTTPFQRVTIAVTPEYGKCLFLDGDLQSAESDQGQYHSALVCPAFKFNPRIKTALILGGGEGATAKQILKQPTVEKVTMVDIDPGLVAICKEYLPQWHQGAFDDPRLKLHYEDAGKFVQQSKEHYDLIVWDLTDPYRWQNRDSTPSTNLYSLNFFRVLGSHLEEGGLLSVEYAYRNRYLLARLLEGFAKVYRRDVYIPSFEEKWIFALMTAK